MAYQFTGTEYVTLGTNSVLGFPDSDWTIAGWVKINSNAGSGEQDFINTGNFSPAGFKIGVTEASNADPDELFTYLQDDDTGVVYVPSTTAPFNAHTAWTHIIVMRSGTTYYIYFDGSELGNSTDATFNAVSATTGAFVHPGGANGLDGLLAEWGKWDRALTDTEKAKLANQWSPLNFTTDLKWYVPMMDYEEEIVPLTVTNHGSTVSPDHPLMFFPNVPLINPTRTILIELQDT